MSTQHGRRIRRADLDRADWRREQPQFGQRGVRRGRRPLRCHAVRDSKETGGPALVFSPHEWRRFLDAAGGDPVHRL
ncbi:DUF397 domain-containing protein [Streptomyces sp. L7]